MMSHKYDTESSFDTSYQRYMQDSDPNRFFAAIYSETRSYCIRHLSRDPDVISDFLLNFLECRLERLIMEFQKRDHPSFPGFFLLCLRNDFANFMRGQRRRAVPTIPLDLNENEAVAEALVYHCEATRQESNIWDSIPRRSQEKELWEAIEEALSQLGGIDPILFKMYHNIPLNICNIRKMVHLYGVERTSDVLRSLEDRRNYRVERLEVVRKRMDRYNSRRLRGECPAGSRKRDSYMQTYQNRYWVHSVQGLATLLGISKQLASIKLRRATKFLRTSLEDYHAELHADEAG